MDNLDDIRALLESDKIKEAIVELTAYVALNPKDDNAFFMLGNAYRRLSDWRNAMNAYCEAIDINPSSPAVEAYRAAEEILNFYHHDLYNP